MKQLQRAHRSALRFYSTLVLVIIIAGMLAACGDNTATTAATTTAAPATTAAATTAAATTAAATTAAATTASAATTAAATGGNTTGVTDTEIVIGGWGPQTGPAAVYGAIDRTIAGYFKKVNDDGGINGRKIKFIFEDDAYSPPRTVTSVKKLVEQDKVFAIVAGLGTPNNVAVMDYLVASGVPHVAPATGSSIICCQPLKKNIFALQTNYSVEGTIMAQYAVASLNTKKAATFYQNDPFGKEGYESIDKVLKAKSLAASTGVTYETTDKDFSSQALKLQQTGADTLFMYSTPQPTAGLLKEIEKLGWKPTLVLSGVNNDPSTIALAGTSIEGAWTAGWLPDYNNATDSKVVPYLDFMKKYLPNETVGGFTVSGYAEAELMAVGLKKAGKNLTRESFIAAMESLNGFDEGMAYKVSYSATNRQGQNAVYLAQASVKDKGFVKKTDFIEYKPNS